MTEEAIEIGEDKLNEVVSRSNNSNKKTSSKKQRKAPSRRNPRGQSAASFATTLILPNSALSANSQPIKRRAVMKKKDVLTWRGEKQPCSQLTWKNK
jgi:hypothetical protein